MTKELHDLVLSRCLPVGECLVWQGAKTTRNGYGQITFQKRHLLTHRIVYEYHHGAIQPGLTVDHVRARGCRFRACCRIEHMEVVTVRENNLRSSAPPALNATKTHGICGHELSGENLVAFSASRGHRNCRKCQARFNREYRRRMMSAPAVEKSCPRCGSVFKTKRQGCCTPCSTEYRRAFAQRDKARRLSVGLCVCAGCKSPLVAGRQRCVLHLAKARESARMSKQRRRQDRLDERERRTA